MSTETVEQIEQATLTVDLVLLAYNSQVLCIDSVLLINGKSGWALPGGKFLKDERRYDALVREMRQEIGLDPLRIATCELFGVFDEPGRDPRGRYVSYAYRLMASDRNVFALQAGSDAKELAWFNLGALPKLAFDHLGIIQCAVRALPGGLQATEVKEQRSERT